MDTPPTVLAAGKFIRLMKRGKWEYAERPGITGIVGIVAVTDDGKLLLVEQYRAPLDKRVIELPAGLVGDTPGAENEDILLAANRELVEETGYEASHLSVAAVGTASAGMTTEVITLVLARGLKKTTAGGGVEGEDITVHEVPLADVISRLSGFEQSGLLVDLKIYSALYFANSPGRK